MIEAAVNTIEFALRENNTGSYPRGLSLMISALNTWLHERDPLMPLRYEEPLAALKESLEADGRAFQPLILDYLVNNPHRTTVILEPDQQLAQRQEAAEKARLAALRAGLNQEDMQRVIDETHELRRLQETPDTPEALATLPMLTLEDLDRESKTHTD